MSDNYNLLKLINKLKYIERHCNATETRPENPTEHSWSVALYAWLLCPEFRIEFEKKLDLNKMLKMALMHDLVEIETNDVSVWNKKERAKQKRYEKAKGFKMLSSFPKEFSDLWKEFEERKTLEAKIIKGLDRLSPVIQRLITRQGWHQIPANVKDLDNMVLTRVRFSKTLLNIYNELKKEALNEGLISE